LWTRTRIVQLQRIAKSCEHIILRRVALLWVQKKKGGCVRFNTYCTIVLTLMNVVYQFVHVRQMPCNVRSTLTSESVTATELVRTWTFFRP
jgi:hypothetical protein